MSIALSDDNIIETVGLSKHFGDFKAVDNISFAVKEKEILGFLGPNGAGKSTTMRMLCTLSRPTLGSTKVAGYDIVEESLLVRKSIGMVSDRIILYDTLTAAENLRFFGRFNRLPRPRLEKRIDELLEYVNMMGWKDQRVMKFSRGMKQRINIARALLHEPRVIFMDEPTLGLDPQTTIAIRDLIRKVSRQDTTIILTTHAMQEADLVCTRIAIIDRGKILTMDTPQNLKNRIHTSEIASYTIHISNLKPPIIQELQKLECITDISQISECDIKTSAKGTEAFNHITDCIRSNGGKITAINTDEPSIEGVFISLTGTSIRDPSHRSQKGNLATN